MTILDKQSIEEQPSQTLAKALIILEAFTVDQPEWGVRELSRELGINPTTIYRIMATYQNAGYLIQDPDTHRYSLGPRVMKLASLYSHINPVPRVAQRVFERHSDEFEHNFYLGTLSNNEMVYLTALDGRGPIKVVVEAGGSTALHTTALGKVLLAHQDDEFIWNYIRTTGLPRLTTHSITDPALLWDMIREIRRLGFAINVGEHYEEVGAIGVPVYEAGGRVKLSVSLAYPYHLVQEKRINPDDLIPLARQIAREISQAMGAPLSRE